MKLFASGRGRLAKKAEDGAEEKVLRAHARTAVRRVADLQCCVWVGARASSGGRQQACGLAPHAI